MSKFLILLVNLILAGSAQQIHLEMTKQELLNTFHTTENIPEYQIVSIEIAEPTRSKRSVDTSQFLINFRVFGKHINLWLNPIHGTLFTWQTPIYRITGQGNDVQIRKDDELFSNTLNSIYQDIEKASTLMVNQQLNGRTNLRGRINHEDNIMLEPLPDRFYNIVDAHRGISDSIPASEQKNHNYHVATRIQENQMYPPDWSRRQRRSLRHKRQVVDCLYPELLIVLTHDYYESFNRDLSQILAYQIAFWSSVDLRYRSLAKPSYRLNIAAIAIAEDPDALDYFQMNDLGKLVMVDHILIDFGSWLGIHNRSIPSNSYDLAITVTNKALCHSFSNTENCLTGPLGLSNTGAICGEDELYHKVHKVAIIHDDGSYQHVAVATHEIGHSLGAQHDNQQGYNCKTDVGYLMSPVAAFNSTVATVWSKCTRDHFREFLRNRIPECLFNKPKQQEKVTRLLPGKLMSLDEQCLKISGGPGLACNTTFDVCSVMACYNEEWDCEDANYGAADGTPCGENSICIFGKCLPETSLTY